MTRNLEIRRIDATLPTDELFEEARGIKEYVYRDFLRLGVSEGDARSFADPNDDDQLMTQVDKLMFPNPSTQYLQILDDGKTAGYAKVGPRRIGDEAPFGEWLRIAAKARELLQQPEDMPRGLHVMAVREGLTQAALTRIYYDHVPKSKTLHVSAHEDDLELNEALTALGAPTGGPKGVIRLGDYAATYIRRSLPPHRNRHP